MDHQDATSETGLLRTHHVKPQDWVKYWMDTSPETIGGCNNDAETIFSAFWALYRLQHPEHKVFQQHGDRLHKVVPLCIHGDEGRAVKRTNFLVCSVESVLGSVQDGRVSQGCSCEAKLMSRPSIPTYEPDTPPPAIDPNMLRVAAEQLTNFKGHSYLSRMLIFGVGGWVYKKHPHIVDALFEELSINMTDLFENGVKVQNGDTYYAACVAVKGDMDFHAKVMDLSRSYKNVGTKNRLEICHMCRAGNRQYSFEDYRGSPEWLSTLFQSRPWNTDSPPSLCQIPFDDQSPERILQGDTFHLIKLGIARDVIGGVLILLLRLKFFDHEGSPTNLDSRFQRAHSYFALWCRATGKTPGLRSFTPAFFNMRHGLMSAPWASTKGSDSILCLEWLVFTLNQQMANPTVAGHDRMLKQMHQVCEACLGVNMVHSHGLWLKRTCARLLYGHFMTLLRGYALLGQKALTLKIRAFIQKPKCHGVHHIAVSLKRQLKLGVPLVLSPQAFACEICEDFLGRISRLSRRVGFRLCHLRVIQHYFLKVSALIRKRKDQKRKKRWKSEDIVQPV